jgi:hypothetical protein
MRFCSAGFSFILRNEGLAVFGFRWLFKKTAGETPVLLKLSAASLLI